MKVAEFDKFAEEYLATHKSNLAVTGESPDYFARYKIVEIARRLGALGVTPKRVLDFGCGIGNSAPHLREAFPEAQITAVDVSEKSLSVARARFPGAAEFVAYDPKGPPPAPAEGYDLIFSACVFHHIEADEHEAIFRRLHERTAPGGRMAIFEHNPVNPVSRYIVATCPFDANAVLIPAGELARRQRKAGFAHVEVTYTGFFPGPLKALRPLEPMMARLPLGAQYYTLAQA
ncbi:methyltransferase domain-containing protein [Phenylobacterium sp. LjRoot225]|uniref:class I SAM-dependent methyltransferase n=1 Tax=Phenylobacterium sp. LjRoot225 TaxID=3342285 RepID=UPI003ECC426D